MAEPALSPAADLVRRAEPDLFYSALFAPEPLRERLLVLYAADIEISRAAQASAEPLIARMRLQWWREIQNAAPPAHEIAGPFEALRRVTGIDPDPLITARERMVAGEETMEPVIARHRALMQLAVSLASGDTATREVAGLVGEARARAFAIDRMARMAAEGRSLLPLPADALTALARRETPEIVRKAVQEQAREGERLLREARSRRRDTDRAALPVLLSAWRANRVFRRAQSAGFDAHAEHADRDAPARARTLLFRALTGRW